MQDYDFEFYIDYNTQDVFCLDCGKYNETNVEHKPIFASDEWDYYPSCDKCKELCDYVTLTEHGQAEIFKKEIVSAKIFSYIRGYYNSKQSSFILTEILPNSVKVKILEEIESNNVEALSTLDYKLLGKVEQLIFLNEINNKYIVEHLKYLDKLYYQNSINTPTL